MLISNVNIFILLSLSFKKKNRTGKYLFLTCLARLCIDTNYNKCVPEQMFEFYQAGAQCFDRMFDSGRVKCSSEIRGRFSGAVDNPRLLPIDFDRLSLEPVLSSTLMKAHLSLTTII